MSCPRVCISVLNLYEEPDETTQVVSQALYNWKVLILKKTQNFFQIETPDGYQGWVKRKGINENSHFQEQGKKVKMAYNAVPVYLEPHVKNQPLIILPFETELNLLDEPEQEDRRWIKVVLSEGQHAWVQRGHTFKSIALLSMQQILELSPQFLGLPYIWGGTSSFGYDCSGFIQMLARQMGIFLPRDAKQQILSPLFCEIDWDKLQSGDIVFYGSHQNDIRHVGLYLGHQTLIHASVKPIPILQKSHLEDESLTKRFSYQTARRFL